jgi:hypothetical protein
MELSRAKDWEGKGRKQGGGSVELLNLVLVISITGITSITSIGSIASITSLAFQYYEVHSCLYCNTRKASMIVLPVPCCQYSQDYHITILPK